MARDHQTGGGRENDQRKLVLTIHPGNDQLSLELFVPRHGPPLLTIDGLHRDDLIVGPPAEPTSVSIRPQGSRAGIQLWLPRAQATAIATGLAMTGRERGEAGWRRSLLERARHALWRPESFILAALVLLQIMVEVQTPPGEMAVMTRLALLAACVGYAVFLLLDLVSSSVARTVAARGNGAKGVAR